ANLRIPTAKLNEAIQQILAERMPSFPGGRRAKIFYATQTGVAPPTIVMFVNQPEHVDASYQRFVVNRLRELLPYDEVPIRPQVRGRRGEGEGGGGEHAGGGGGGAGGGGKGKGEKGSKPHPKKQGRRGAARGTRPKR